MGQYFTNQQCCTFSHAADYNWGKPRFFINVGFVVGAVEITALIIGVFLGENAEN